MNEEMNRETGNILLAECSPYSEKKEAIKRKLKAGEMRIVFYKKESNKWIKRKRCKRVLKEAEKEDAIPLIYDEREKCYDIGFLSAGNECFEKKDYENAMKNYFKFLVGAKNNYLRRLSGLNDESFDMKKFMKGMRYTLPELACKDTKTYIENEYFELITEIS